MRVDELMSTGALAGVPAVALTDECNLFAMVKFYRAALAAGIKPVIGVDLWLRDTAERAEPSRLTLLCQDQAGYRNLSQLLTRAYLEGERQSTPLIERDWLTADSLTGLIALSGGWEGDVGRALLTGRPQLGAATAAGVESTAAATVLHRVAAPRSFHRCRLRECPRSRWLPSAMCRWWLPMTCASSRPKTTRRTKRGCASAIGRCLPIRRASGASPVSNTCARPAEMAALFADLPAALVNSVEIARRCSLPLKLGSSQLPVFPDTGWQPGGAVHPGGRERGTGRVHAGQARPRRRGAG